MPQDKTIAAISTALSPAGISVIRVSGEKAVQIADAVFRSSSKKLSGMQGYTCAFGYAYRQEEKLDEVIAAVFRAPHSYTGEDVVELSCHGGMAVTADILRALLENGAVPAEPGEFTKRAFLNGKMDLPEAESVMDIISARSKTSARAAIRVKDGYLSRKINELKSTLIDKAAHLNAWADYPEEDIPEVSETELKKTLSACDRELQRLLTSYDNGKLLKEGINTVIVGKPNVGKSTLMNLLSGYDKSIVTSIAGTTRDVVEESVNLDGITLNLSDTAGIRDTADEIERIGVDKARSRLSSASLVLCVFDASAALSDEDETVLSSLSDVPTVAVINKSDLEQRLDVTRIQKKINNIVYLSSKTGEGLDELTETVKKLCLSADFDSDMELVYNERQRNLTEKARNAVSQAIDALIAGVTYDAVTVLIEEAVAYLSELTGENVTEEVVDRVFHSFCVGK